MCRPEIQALVTELAHVRALIDPLSPSYVVGTASLAEHAVWLLDLEGRASNLIGRLENDRDLSDSARSVASGPRVNTNHRYLGGFTE